MLSKQPPAPNLLGCQSVPNLPDPDLHLICQSSHRLSLSMINHVILVLGLDARSRYGVRLVVNSVYVQMTTAIAIKL